MSAAAFVKLDKIICVFLTEILENFVLSIFLIDILMSALWLICPYAYICLSKNQIRRAAIIQNCSNNKKIIFVPSASKNGNIASYSF